jgi:hypothetical protein
MLVLYCNTSFAFLLLQRIWRNKEKKILLTIDKARTKGNTYSGCRCNERLKVKAEGSTCLTYTGLCGGLSHLKIETRLRGESFESVMGVCVILNR